MTDDFGIRRSDVYVKVAHNGSYRNVGGGFLRKSRYGGFLYLRIRENIPAGSEVIIAETNAGRGVVLKQPS